MRKSMYLETNTTYIIYKLNLSLNLYGPGVHNLMGGINNLLMASYTEVRRS
jgi:hypothetical protein